MAGLPPIGTAGQFPVPSSGLLFYLSGDHGFRADSAAGRAEPNFRNGVSIVPGGFRGSAIHCEDGRQQFSYWAPGNIYAQRGTLAFAWRGAQPFTQTEFPLFRVGYADHSSWDMVWLRIDYNGHGFDAFVTDANLARVRVSYTMPKLPAPDEWTHFALTWDETEGIRFYVNGQKVAENKTIAVLNTGLDQFGPHSRIISPWQVQSAYNFIRGGEIDEIRIYDQALADGQIAILAQGNASDIKPFMRNPRQKQWIDEWALRYGWNRPGDLPSCLADNETVIRKVQINDVYDQKRWWWKGTDGIRETTWPGVYNRSRLPGRNDYFQLPDWDCYTTSGKQVRFLMPDEPWNYVEVAGAAYGTLAVSSSTEGTGATTFSTRLANQERTFHKTASPVTGKSLVFTNDAQETPIGELNAYYIHPGKAPSGVATLSYTLTSRGNHNNENIFDIEAYIAGRYPADERSVMLATPGANGGRSGRRGDMPSYNNTLAPHRAVPADRMPIVHVIIPSDFRPTGLVYEEDAPLMARGASYTWRNMNGGLDGIRIALPALDVAPTMDGCFPINIQVKDPIWPLRNMFDFTFSVKPGQGRVLYLDLRDRILPDDKPLYLTLAGSDPDFSPVDLEGTRIDLIFKSLDEAKKEHVADRFTQVRDTYAMIVEEGTNSKRLNKYNQFEADMTDLLRIEPNHWPGYNYWYIYNSEQVKPTVEPLVVPDSVPRWAFLQLENLKRHKYFVEYYIDKRQIASGQFGG
ncbi:MAG: LamG domain-containing protein, partial [Rikenellaceae bacterium]|nr:LamG domain-containing protein [Rikenellaceae bacterium]